MGRADLSLVETSDGLQVVFDGRALYDARPASGAARKARSLPVQAQTLYLVPSPVAWHGVLKLLSRISDDSAILAVESEPVLLELARRLRPVELSGPEVMLCAADANSVRAALGSSATDRTGLGRFRRVREITLCRGALINRSRYREIREELEQDIRIVWQNRLTLSAMGRLWIGNVIRNLPCLSGAAVLPALHGAVVVCGAGPSLSASVPLLRDERRGLTILAVDTALPSLVQSGVTPDFVIAIEGQLANLYDFLPVGGRDYTLVADLSSAPSVIELHDPARVVWVSSRFADLGLLDRIAAAGLPLRTIPPLGSVGVAAAEIAFSLTDGPVLFAGLDFAFRSATHVRGAPAHLSQLIRGQRLRNTPPPDLAGRWLERRGADGRPVSTTLAMIGYAEQLSALVRADAATGRSVFAVEPFGLETGAEAVTVGQAGTVAGRAATESPGPRQPGQRGLTPNGQSQHHVHQIERLLGGELELLDRLGSLVNVAVAADDTPERDPALEDAFELCDYVAVDFPDLPDLRPFTGKLHTNRAFLTRMRVAIDFYRDRLDRSLRYLRS